MKKWTTTAIIVFLGLCIFAPSPFRETFAAEKAFPNKEITIICSFAPGGSRDILARGVAKVMGKHLGVPIVVVNTPGAGGARGAIQLFHSAPDGYTVGLGTATEVLLQIVEKHEFDIKKFTNLGRVQSSPEFVYVKADSPFKSFKDFKGIGKSVRLSALGILQSSTVPVIILAKREGFPLSIISGFPGAPPAILSVIRGEVEMVCHPLSPALPFLKAGQIRPILTVDRERYPEFPDVPTVGDIGYKDLGNFALDYWMMAPPGVSAEHAKVLEDAVAKTVKDPEFIAWAKGAGVDPAPMGAKEMSKNVIDLFSLLEGFKGDIEGYLKK